MKVKKYLFTEIHAFVKTKSVGYGARVESAFRDMQERKGYIDPSPWRESKKYWSYEIKE